MASFELDAYSMVTLSLVAIAQTGAMLACSIPCLARGPVSCSQGLSIGTWLSCESPRKAFMLDSGVSRRTQHDLRLPEMPLWIVES